MWKYADIKLHCWTLETFETMLTSHGLKKSHDWYSAILFVAFVVCHIIILLLKLHFRKIHCSIPSCIYTVFPLFLIILINFYLILYDWSPHFLNIFLSIIIFKFQTGVIIVFPCEVRQWDGFGCGVCPGPHIDTLNTSRFHSFYFL